MATPEYSINDFAKVTTGTHAGKIGKVISIPMREDGDVRYHLIFKDDIKGAYLSERWLEPAFGDEDEAIIESMVISDSNFKGMATVGGGFDSIKLSVYDNEGTIPHFHFYKGIAPENGINYKKRSGGGCICILTAEYFIHGKHNETMKKKEVEDLIKFLKAKSAMGVSNWKYIIKLWNDNNPNQKQVLIDTPIPEYKHDMKSIH